MSLRVFIGTANAGKTGILHARLRDRVGNGERGALLLPSAPDVSRDLRELSADIPIGLTVTTFDAYLDGLWSDAFPERKIISPTRRMQLLADIVSTVHLDDLGPSASTPGFLSALAGFVERAVRSGADVLGGDAKNGAGREVLLLLRKYEDRLSAEGLVERSSAHRILSLDPALWSPPEVVAVNRFTGFTAAQETFLAALAVRSEVLVALTFDERVPATSAARDQVSRLAAVGEVIPVAADREHSTSPELVRIEVSLGQPATANDDGIAAEGAVVISEAWGGAAEAGRVVREVQEALGAGVPAGSIAIAFRDLASHARALRSALEEAALDTDWDLRVRFDATRLGRASLLLLSYVGGARRVEEAMDLLRSPYAPASQDALDELDARLRSSRTRSARPFERLLQTLDVDAAAFLADARAAVRALGTQVSEVLWWRLLGRMLANARPGATLLDVDGLLDAAAARVLLGSVVDLSEAGTAGVSAVSLAAALRASPVSIGSANRPDTVQVMSVERLRGRRYRCVILGGLTAGEFPRQVRDDAFESPALRADLARAGIEIPPSGSLDDERLMFYQAVTRASDRLVLSRQSHDADGRPLRPSVFLEELLDLYRRADDLDWRHGEPPRHVLGLDDAEDSEWAPRSERRAWRAALAVPEGDDRTDVPDRLAHARYRVRSRPDCLGSTARETLAARTVFSVTDIETYLGCPYRWYMQRVIRPHELDAEVDAAAGGRLAHDILRETYDRFTTETGCERVDQRTLARALEVHAGVAAAAAERVRTSGAAEEAAVRAVVRHTAGILEDDVRLTPGFVPRYREWSFGLTADDPPEPFGTFSLVGRIDRIDVDDRRLIITDYKSGRVSSDRSRNAFAARGLVQAPLYAAVAARRLGLEPAGGVYRSIKGGRLRGFIRDDVFVSDAFTSTDRVTAEEIELLIADAVARAEVAVDGMRAGEIPARPLNDACPAYCPARALCARGGDVGADAR